MISWLLCGLGGAALIVIHLWERPWREMVIFTLAQLSVCLALGPLSWPFVAALVLISPLDKPPAPSRWRRLSPERPVAVPASRIGVQTMRIAVFDEETFEALAVLDLPEPPGGARDGAVIRFHVMSPQSVFDPPPLGIPVEPAMVRYAEVRLRQMVSRLVRGETVRTWVGFTRDRDLVLQRARAGAEGGTRSRYYETAQRHIDFGREAQAEADPHVYRDRRPRYVGFGREAQAEPDDAAEGRSRDLLRRHRDPPA